MSLEEILTNRNRLSEDILTEIKEVAAGYGVAIRRADVKDLVFPGNLQEIMNRVLAAQRNSEAQLVEARTKAEVEEIQGKTRAEAKRREAETDAVARRLQLEAEAEAARLKAENETRALVERQKAAEALEKHPGLLRLAELEALRELARNANARVYLGLGDGVLKIGDDRRSPRMIARGWPRGWPRYALQVYRIARQTTNLLDEVRFLGRALKTTQ